MNDAQLYAFVTSLLFGYQMDITLYQTYRDASQSEVEGVRLWMVLRAVDSSQTAAPGNGYNTPLTLGSTTYPFVKFFQSVTTPSIILLDANNNATPLREVPFAQRFMYKDLNGVFCVNYATKQLYILGNLTQSYTVLQNYVYRPGRISNTGVTPVVAWVFDSYDADASKILGFLIAIKWKGIDYDIINLQNVAQLGQAAAAIMDRLTSWDADMQVNAQSGIDPFGTGTTGWQAGRLPGGIGPS